MDAGAIIDLGFAKAMSATHGPRNLSLSRALALVAINEALHNIERRALWTFLEGEEELTSTQDQREIDGVPEDYLRATALYDSATERKLDYFDDRQGVLPLRDRGIPSHYSDWGGNLKLWPVPSTTRTYLLRYYGEIPEMEDEDSVPVIPSMFHPILASYVARVMLLRAPAEGQRFLPASAAEPFDMEWREGLLSMLESPFTLKSLEPIPWLEHTQMTVDGLGQDW